MREILNSESETAPEENLEDRASEAAINAVLAIEQREAADNPKWRQEAVKYLKTGGRVALDGLGLSLAIIPKVIFGVLGFAKRALLSLAGGEKMSFNKEFEKGEEMFSFDEKQKK